MKRMITTKLSALSMAAGLLLVVAAHVLSHNLMNYASIACDVAALACFCVFAYGMDRRDKEQEQSRGRR